MTFPTVRVRGYLFLDEYNTTVSPLIGAPITDPALPGEIFTGAADGNATVTINSFNETLMQGACGAGEHATTVDVTVAFLSGSEVAYVLWGGHLAKPTDPGVGAGNGAGSFPGSSLHMGLASPSKTASINPDAIIQFAQITVQKVVDSGTATPSQFCFSINPIPAGETSPKCPIAPGDTVIFAGAGGATNVPVNYTITEVGPAGYAFVGGSGTSCSFLGATATATVTANPVPTDATCVFHNAQQTGSITVTKQTLPDGSLQSFEFDPSWSGTNFSLTDGQSNPTNLPVGNYSVAEVNLPGDWDLTSAACTSNQPGDTSTPGAITLNSNESIVCTFNNTQRAQIIVDKVTDPAGSAQLFEFDPSWSGTNFSLADATTPANSGFLVAANNFSVAEVNLPAGWDLGPATCTSTQPGDTSTPADIDLSPGEIVTCVFVNTQRAQIIVDKVTNPTGSPQLFEFDPSWSGTNFSLADATSPANSGFLVPANNYAVAEVNLPAGWDPTSATCTSTQPGDTSTPADIDLSPGEIVTCVFVNTQRAQIIVDKVTDPGGSTDQFGFDPSYGPDFSLSDVDAPNNSGFLVPADDYSVVETTLPPGWDPTSVTCTSSLGGTTPNTDIDLAPGEIVTCVFVNTQRAQIIVDKVTDPAGSTDQFSFDPSYGPDFSLSDVDAPNNSGFLVPADDYSVVETTLPPGWDPTSVTCTSSLGGTTPNTDIDLAPGEIVTCVFVNTQRAQIIVDKVTDPAGSTDQFGFDPSYGPDFSLADGDAPNNSGFLVPADDYSVVETTLPPGWDPTSVTCTSSLGGTTPNTDIDLSPGEIVTCVFVNTQRAQIIVDKVTNPAGSAQLFEFDPSWSGTNFFLADATSPANSGFLVPANNYAVAEVNLPAGWDPTSATCTSTQPGDTSTPADIDLAPGEVVTCVFVNTQRAQIIVDKVTDPAGSTDQFGFDPSYGPDFSLADGDAPNNSGFLVPADDYSVVETTLPPGWDPTSVTCTSSLGGTTPNTDIDLSPGEIVTCVFVNTQRAQIIVDKVTNPAGSAQLFEFDPSWSGTNFFLADATSPANSGFLVPANNYAVAEVNLPAGWDPTSATCTSTQPGDTSTPADIDLAPGEIVTCVFVNTQRAQIIVDKVTDPAGSTDQFGFDPSYGPDFSLADVDPPNNSGFLVPADDYSVVETTLPPGWDPTSVTCTSSLGGTTPNTDIDLSPGEIVTCVFVNTQRAQIIVDKVTDPGGSTEPFGFDPSYGPDFSLADGDTPNNSGFLVPADDYSVVETTLPPGWDPTSVTCTSSLGGTTPNTDIDLAPGEIVTCVFVNTQRAQIIVDKVTDPAGSTDQFSFDPSYGPDFSLSDVDAPNNSGFLVPANNYSVAETTCPRLGPHLGDLHLISGRDHPQHRHRPVPRRNRDLRVRQHPTRPDHRRQGHRPGGSTDQFGFDPSYGPDFSLADGDAPNNSGFLVPADDYSVVETTLPPAGTPPQ